MTNTPAVPGDRYQDATQVDDEAQAQTKAGRHDFDTVKWPTSILKKAPHQSEHLLMRQELG